MHDFISYLMLLMRALIATLVALALTLSVSGEIQGNACQIEIYFLGQAAEIFPRFCKAARDYVVYPELFFIDGLCYSFPRQSIQEFSSSSILFRDRSQTCHTKSTSSDRTCVSIGIFLDKFFPVDWYFHNSDYVTKSSLKT